MSEEKYNTNLAAEFHVLSVLHRLGASASLTLGNKKSVDIAVITGLGKSVTIDVKGLAGTTSWPVDNVNSKNPNHFLAFVCFNKRIQDPTTIPDVWIVPVARVERLTALAGQQLPPQPIGQSLGASGRVSSFGPGDVMHLASPA